MSASALSFTRVCNSGIFEPSETAWPPTMRLCSLPPSPSRSISRLRAWTTTQSCRARAAPTFAPCHDMSSLLRHHSCTSTLATACLALHGPGAPSVMLACFTTCTVTLLHACTMPHSHHGCRASPPTLHTLAPALHLIAASSRPPHVRTHSLPKCLIMGC